MNAVAIDAVAAYGSERRDHLAGTADRRAVRTRQRLVRALSDAIEAGVGEVTVTEVCRQAAVGRSTFYAHFRTIEDLLVATFADTFAAGALWEREQRSFGDVSSADITRRGLARTVESFQSLRAVVAYANASGGRGNIERRLVLDVAQGMISALAETGADPADASDLQAHFLAAGLVHVVLASLDPVEPGATPMSSTELVNQLSSMFPAALPPA